MTFSARKIQTVATSSIFLTASALSLTAGITSNFGGFDTSYAPAMILCSAGLIVAGLILAVVFKSWNNRPRPDLHD